MTMKRMAFVGSMLTLASVLALGGVVDAQEAARDGRGAGQRAVGQEPRAATGERAAGDVAPPRPGGPPAGLRAPAPGDLEQLGLTDAQRTRIASLQDVEERAVIRAEADARLAELDLRTLVQADTPDSRAIDAQLDRIAVLRSGITKAQVATLLGVRSVLTVEQRAKLREHRASAGGPGRSSRPAVTFDDRPAR